MEQRLSEQQRAHFRRRLQEARGAVVAELRRVLLATDEEHYVELAGRVHDSAEASVADLLSDLDLADADRLVTELREIDAARERLSEGGYGICSDCGRPIDEARLEANPAARRCIDCQRRHEEAEARLGGRPPTL